MVKTETPKFAALLLVIYLFILLETFSLSKNALIGIVEGDAFLPGFMLGNFLKISYFLYGGTHTLVFGILMPPMRPMPNFFQANVIPLYKMFPRISLCCLGVFFC